MNVNVVPEMVFLKRQKKDFDQLLEKSIPSLGKASKLRDACEYALLNGGKRIRPLIVGLIAKELGFGLNVDKGMLAVEYFHTASLIADDLPCMDNDDYRRDKPSLHKVYGETVALLASYALIAAGYEKIYEAVGVLRSEKAPFSEKADRVCVVALKYASYCGGIEGATGGQFLDLFPQEKTLGFVREVLHKKTVTLFEISFVFGWIFGGGELENLERVRKAATHFGMAFQIADDLQDLEEDEKGGSFVNMALFLGKDEAQKLFRQEMKRFTEALDSLNLLTPAFKGIVDLLFSYAER